MDIWSVFDLLAPACLVCGLPAKDTATRGIRLCRGCHHDLPGMPTVCHRCGLPGGDSVAPCLACQQAPPPLDRLLAARAYAFPLDRLVQRLKFAGCLPVAEALGHLLAERVEAQLAEDGCRPALLVPIPLSRERLRQRGFNQAERIARPVARRLGIPLCTDRLLRSRDTRAQSTMDLAERQANLRDAFAVQGPLPGHVALVDDVMTSGSTLHAAAEVLREAGVARVDAWVVARTL